MNNEYPLNRLFCWLVLLAFLTGRGARAEDGRERVVVIAHRGNHENAHENTVEAIRAAIHAGADYVELDVRRTKDRRHILMHDRTLKRMTGAAGQVNEFTLAQIRELKVRDPQRTAIPPAQIPTLEEALDAIGTKIGLYLDFKEGDPAEIAAELRHRSQTPRVVVYLSPDSVAPWKSAEPSIRLIMSVPDKSLSPETLPAFLKSYPGVILDGAITDYTAELIRVAHASGTKVWPDIQNPDESPEQWSQAVKLGVDGLQTDHPSALVAWLKSIGRH